VHQQQQILDELQRLPNHSCVTFIGSNLLTQS
jgi:hypothetical protein